MNTWPFGKSNSGRAASLILPPNAHTHGTSPSLVSGRPGAGSWTCEESRCSTSLNAVWSISVPWIISSVHAAKSSCTRSDGLMNMMPMQGPGMATLGIQCKLSYGVNGSSDASICATRSRSHACSSAHATGDRSNATSLSSENTESCQLSICLIMEYLTVFRKRNVTSPQTTAVSLFFTILVLSCSLPPHLSKTSAAIAASVMNTSTPRAMRYSATSSSEQKMRKAAPRFTR
eukprot:Amastigsp_a8617_6.p2 type:complete len:232 gc:universal Amastigsp_a8617_6:1213-518(-)